MDKGQDKVSSNGQKLQKNYKIPKKVKLDSVAESSIPGESKHRLNSVVVVPPPDEFRPRSSQYQPTRTWFSTKRPTRSYQAIKYSEGSNSRKRQRSPQAESGSERQATEVVQMLTAALKKVHLTSVAVQTGKSTTEVATQSDLKDISPQGSTPEKKPQILQMQGEPFEEKLPIQASCTKTKTSKRV